MAKIERKTQKIFGSNSSDNGQIGSAQTGTKILSNDLDVLQQLNAFVNGLNDVTISGQKLLPLEELQALNYIQTTQLAYLFQEGIPEFDTTLATEYYIRSITRKPNTYELYGSKIDNNIGNALPSQVDDANWQYLGDLSLIATFDPAIFQEKIQYLHVQDQKPSGTDGGASVVGIQTRVLNTVLENSITGASLSSNQITLPAGKYKVTFSGASYRSQFNQSLLYDVTNDIYLGKGVPIYNSNNNDIADASGKFSLGSAIFTLTGNTLIELRSYINIARPTDGLGRACNSGQGEVYSDVLIEKVGD